MQKSFVAFAGIAMLILFFPPAFASMDMLETGIYKEMKESRDKVSMATQPGAEGSGTPVFAADGVLGASIISGGIFGGIAAAFFIRGRKGKYAAMGRG